ncbi:Hypothetical protein POVR2_LOCUS70 [uncultured virus]|nr:Hypothetical protein POVR2_LOCUS70 [uncultured virus]
MSLPDELLNEPFPDYRDNGLRVEIVIPRPRFEYTISASRVEVKMRGEILHSKQHYTWSVPSKSSSRISILNVYDTYGLEIAVLFLQHVLGMKAKYDCFIDVYLDGCLSALGISVPKSYIPPDIEKLVTAHLNKIDKRQPRGISDATVCTLPIELVPLVTQSLRISKAVSSLILAHRETLVPIMSHVIGWCASDRTLYYKEFVDWRSQHFSISRMHDGQFLLQPSTGGHLRRSNPRVMGVGTKSYRAYYRSRGCNPDRAMLHLLAKLQQDVATMSLIEVGAWLCQLSSDSSVQANEMATSAEHLRTLLSKKLEQIMQAS